MKQIEAIKSLEASVLGAILLNPAAIGEFPRLEVDDFCDVRHRIVWLAMRNLESTGRPIDVVTIEAEAAKHTDQSGIVDFAFLGELALHVPTVSNAHEYVRRIREASLSRKVRAALADICERGDRFEMSGAELLTVSLEALSRIDEDQPDDAQDISALVGKRLKQLEQIAEDKHNGKRLTGFPTGVSMLDEKIGGIQPGIVTIVAARPGMGKSSLGLAIADASSASGFGVHLFSLEDTEEAYADRTLSRSSGVHAESLRNAEITKGNSSELAKAVMGLRGRRWKVDGRSGITAEEIVRSVRRHRRQNGTCVVIVDYVQLVKRGFRQSAHEALGEIITTLADAAKHDRMAYVVMSQLNRQIESRQDKRPLLSDLRESGSLEERAKCVIGLYRGAAYNTGPIKGVDWDPDWDGHSHSPADSEFQTHVQLHVLKNSNGRTGHVWATWNGPTTRIS